MRAHLMTFMMALDRSFYFHLIRGHGADYALVVQALADQWMSLITRF